MSKNLRKHERKHIKVSVELTFLDEPYAVVNTRNISQGGMFIEVDTAVKFPIGEMVSVHYLDPLNNDADTFKDAIIVHKNDDGFGICFIEMTEFKD
ncbi:MAG: PilZ domain-containing protein [Gammaproteobacteria bacterium]|nr:PilZ domain-containing protein [Gammaproteobacteria bacterium]